MFYSETQSSPDPKRLLGEKCPIKAVPVPTTTTPAMHRGALGPQLGVGDDATSSKTKEDDDDNLESYQRRLICAVTGRFVLIERADASKSETLVASAGRPRPGVRYRWRYWDNAGHVYDDLGEKYRAGFAPQAEFENRGVLPGDFREGLKTWMRVGSGGFDPFDFDTITEDVRLRDGEKLQTTLSSFWDCLWSWKHEGSTGCLQWDERLDLLAKTAGVQPSLKYSWMWPLQESELDALASGKGWEKLQVRQPAMASYRKDGVRLNFYLSTGTVGSALDHPRQGKTQLFRRNVQDANEAAAFFDDPRQHTGKGYQTKDQERRQEQQQATRKRKADGAPLGRICAQCGETRATDEFSKNQRRKGSAARCRACVDAS